MLNAQRSKIRLGAIVFTAALGGLFLFPGTHQAALVSAAAKASIDSAAIARAYVSEHSPNLTLSTITATTDALGQEHIRYNQRYQGVPIFGGQIIVHVNKNTMTHLVTGKTLRRVAVDTTPHVSATAAHHIAQTLAKHAGATADLTVKKTNLYIFNEQLLNKLRSDKNILVWEVELFSDQPLWHEYYYIDAHTGTLVYQIHGAQDAIYRQIYDCSYTYDCYLDARDSSTGYTYGRSEGQPARGANPNYYITSLTDTDDLYSVLGAVYNYYADNFARAGANDNGGMGDGSSTYPTANTVGLTYLDYFYNSYFDYTSCPNAFFDGAASIRFCEGFVKTDVAGHEYAHAVNYFSILDSNGDYSGLAYTNESGALNEANSDVFGEALEYAVNGSNDWLMGEDLSIGALRSMSDPTTFTYVDDNGTTVPYPDRYNSEQLYCGTTDSGGVHYNSSVINKAAYLMAMGGTFNNCTITGLGRSKEENIFYRAETEYYTPTTDFNGAYTALLAACADLYSVSDCREVAKALKAVELDQAGFCSGTPGTTPDCAAVDAAPTITSISSDQADGTYAAGAVIDIDVTFSEAVKSDHEVVIELETGQNDRTCSFTVSAETTGSCDYTVQAGDNSADLTVKSSTGSIADVQGDNLTSTVPETNLADNKDIVIDAVTPKIPATVKVYTSANKHKRIATIHPRTQHRIITAGSVTPYFVWPRDTDVKNYYVIFTDKPITAQKLLQAKHKRTIRYIRGHVTKTNKIYSLYMILRDQAGNTSRRKTVLRYRIR